jgi:hypothetical protein
MKAAAGWPRRDSRLKIMLRGFGPLKNGRSRRIFAARRAAADRRANSGITRTAAAQVGAHANERHF